MARRLPKNLKAALGTMSSAELLAASKEIETGGPGALLVAGALVSDLDRTLTFARSRHGVGDRSLDLALDLARDLDRLRDGVRDRFLDLDLALARDLGLDGDLDLDLVLARASVLARVRISGLELDRAFAVADDLGLGLDGARASARARDLDLALDRDRDLALHLDRLSNLGEASHPGVWAALRVIAWRELCVVAWAVSIEEQPPPPPSNVVISLEQIQLVRNRASRAAFHQSIESVVAETARLEGDDAWDPGGPEFAQVQRRKTYLIGYLKFPADDDPVEQAEADRIAALLEIQNLNALASVDEHSRELIGRVAAVLDQITAVDGGHSDGEIARRVAIRAAEVVEETLPSPDDVVVVDDDVAEVVDEAAEEGISTLQASLGWRRRVGESTRAAAERVGGPVPVANAVSTAVGGAAGLAIGGPAGAALGTAIGRSVGVGVGLIWAWLNSFKDSGEDPPE